MAEGEDDDEKCIVCFEAIAPSNRATQRCEHHVCSPCFAQYLTVSIVENCHPFPRCPQVACTQVASTSLVRAHVDEKTLARMNYLRVLHPTRASDGRRLWCVREGCYEPLAPPEYVELAVRERPGEVLGDHRRRRPYDMPRCLREQVAAEQPYHAREDEALEEEARTSSCAACGTSACMQCAAPAHNGNCIVPLTDMRQRQLYAHYAVGRVAPCPSCGAHVERNGGCDLMRCTRCMGHFLFAPFQNTRQVQESFAFINPHAKIRRESHSMGRHGPYLRHPPVEADMENIREEYNYLHNYVRNRFFRRAALENARGAVTQGANNRPPSRASRLRRMFSRTDASNAGDNSTRQERPNAQTEAAYELPPIGDVSSSTWGTEETEEPITTAHPNRGSSSNVRRRTVAREYPDHILSALQAMEEVSGIVDLLEHTNADSSATRAPTDTTPPSNQRRSSSDMTDQVSSRPEPTPVPSSRQNVRTRNRRQPSHYGSIPGSAFDSIEALPTPPTTPMRPPASSDFLRHSGGETREQSTRRAYVDFAMFDPTIRPSSVPHRSERSDTAVPAPPSTPLRNTNTRIRSAAEIERRFAMLDRLRRRSLRREEMMPSSSSPQSRN